MGSRPKIRPSGCTLAGEIAEKKAASLKDIAKHWSVDGEELSTTATACTHHRENYGDFELLVDYKTVAKADSGIYLRGIPQVQIWDYTKEGGKWNIGADKGSGGLWNNSKGALVRIRRVGRQPFGEWFHSESSWLVSVFQFG